MEAIPELGDFFRMHLECICIAKLSLYWLYLAPIAIGWSAIFCYHFVTPSWILCKIVLAFMFNR